MTSEQSKPNPHEAAYEAMHRPEQKRVESYERDAKTKLALADSATALLLAV